MKKENLIKTGRDAVWLSAALIYPPRCPLCDGLLMVRGSKVCQECEKKLPRVTEPACMKCGKPLSNPEDEFCEDCACAHHLFDGGRAAFVYTGSMRHSVYRMKFRNRRDYLDFYAESMVQAGKLYLDRWRPELIVPVPMHWKKRAARGYNQAGLLAKRVSYLTGIPWDPHFLYCVRETGNQKELGRKDRMRNLRGSFDVHQKTSEPGARKSVRRRCRAYRNTENKPPETILLIDDVYTTGSTLDEASRALKQAGVRQIFFLVLCTGMGKKSLHASKSVLY